MFVYVCVRVCKRGGLLKEFLCKVLFFFFMLVPQISWISEHDQSLRGKGRFFKGLRVAPQNSRAGGSLGPGGRPRRTRTMPPLPWPQRLLQVKARSLKRESL